jgi:hypothetical protein
MHCSLHKTTSICIMSLMHIPSKGEVREAHDTMEEVLCSEQVHGRSLCSLYNPAGLSCSVLWLTHIRHSCLHRKWCKEKL